MSEREEAHVDQTKNVLEPVMEAAQKQIEAFTHAQSDLTKKANEIGQYWVDRGRYEANIASELSSKLAVAHSIPDVMTAWQEWGRQRFQRMADDNKHLLADIQDVMKSGASLLSKSSI